MSIKIVPVIMAGGKGTRLWPLSRAAAAKQFIRFLGDETLLQKTLSDTLTTQLQSVSECRNSPNQESCRSSL